MKTEDLQQYLAVEVNECHSIAVSKGFWNTNDPNKYEKLALIISELGEALNADRESRRADIAGFEAACTEEGMVAAFEKFVKDSFEDEIVDVMIRIFDYCGHYKLSLVTIRPYDLHPRLEQTLNTGEQLFYCMGLVCLLNGDAADDDKVMRRVLWSLVWLCKNRWDVDFVQHIFLKKQYNRTRAMLHGKKY